MFGVPREYYTGGAIHRSKGWLNISGGTFARQSDASHFIRILRQRDALSGRTIKNTYRTFHQKRNLYRDRGNLYIVQVKDPGGYGGTRLI